jgi:hypothetical protein
VGTSTALERPYLRSSTNIDPSTIRSEPVLIESMKLVTRNYSCSHDYQPACEQLKSIRQDITIQHIFDSFAIEVYEYAARLALLHKDFGEFNQCQTQLLILHEKVGLNCKNVDEFVSYRILYLSYVRKFEELNNVLIQSSNTRSYDVSLAVSICKSVLTKNYSKFFHHLSSWILKPGFTLLEEIAGKMRLCGISRIIKSYRPSISVNSCQEILGFHQKNDFLEFLNSQRIFFLDDAKTMIDCRKTSFHLQSSISPAVSVTFF